MINKKRLFDLLWLHYAQSEGGMLPGVRMQIDDLDRVAAVELWKFYQTPEGLWEWL